MQSPIRRFMGGKNSSVTFSTIERNQTNRLTDRLSDSEPRWMQWGLSGYSDHCLATDVSTVICSTSGSL